MGDDDGQGLLTIVLTGKILMVAAILLFLLVVFLLFLHLYAKWFWYRQDDQQSQPGERTTRRHRRRRLDFSPGHIESSVPRQKRAAIDPLVLKSLPVVAYDAKEFEDGVECAVCLSDLVDGEKLRLLPECSHGFHVECIDMWFQSHSTCPLCRSTVSSSFSSSFSTTALETSSHELLTNPYLPTDVIFCGEEEIITTSYHSQSSSSSSSPLPPSSSAAAMGMVAIDVSE